MQKFVETSGQKDISNVNYFYETCQKNQTPYILIEKSRVYATVRLDYISYTCKNEEMINQNQQHYLEELKSLHQKYSNPKSKYFFGHGLVEFYDIEIQKTHEMANELHYIVLRIVAPQK